MSALSAMVPLAWAASETNTSPSPIGVAAARCTRIATTAVATASAAQNALTTSHQRDGRRIALCEKGTRLNRQKLPNA
jgi:hypothetical protein